MAIFWREGQLRELLLLHYKPRPLCPYFLLLFNMIRLLSRCTVCRNSAATAISPGQLWLAGGRRMPLCFIFLS
ncbi:hypothetical protein [Chitinophaga polysaccharea]|nr:hypothetical protein [Chitinophaga polysaccharea]